MAEWVIFTGYVPDADVPALLSGALAFTFPSLYEGFGMPVLEAMACGAPVLAANSSSLPEAAGDAAILADPTDTAAIPQRRCCGWRASRRCGPSCARAGWRARPSLSGEASRRGQRYACCAGEQPMQKMPAATPPQAKSAATRHTARAYVLNISDHAKLESIRVGVSGRP